MYFMEPIKYHNLLDHRALQTAPFLRENKKTLSFLLTIGRSSAVWRERFCKCQSHLQKQCHHTYCFLPSTKHLPSQGFLCDLQTFLGEYGGFLKEHHLLKETEPIIKQRCISTFYFTFLLDRTGHTLTKLILQFKNFYKMAEVAEHLIYIYIIQKCIFV